MYNSPLPPEQDVSNLAEHFAHQDKKTGIITSLNIIECPDIL